jgi:hypothetical protein
LALFSIRAYTETLEYWPRYFIVILHIEYWILAGQFITVVATNAVAVGKLLLTKTQQETRRTTRKATITVGIISAIYCVCNIEILVYLGIIYYLYPFPFSRGIHPSGLDKLKYISLNILVPLNSACNPVVYLMRKADMRVYLKSTWNRMLGSIMEKWRKRKRREGRDVEPTA